MENTNKPKYIIETRCVISEVISDREGRTTIVPRTSMSDSWIKTGYDAAHDDFDRLNKTLHSLNLKSDLKTLTQEAGAAA